MHPVRPGSAFTSHAFAPLMTAPSIIRKGLRTIIKTPRVTTVQMLSSCDVSFELIKMVGILTELIPSIIGDSSRVSRFPSHAGQIASLAFHLANRKAQPWNFVKENKKCKEEDEINMKWKLFLLIGAQPGCWPFNWK